MDRLWRIELFGGVQLVRADGAQTRFSTRKVAALLAYLSYFPDRPHSREVLAEMLWPETEFDAQRNSFRVALNSLRRQIEPPGIALGAVLLADRNTARLHPDAFTTDVALFEAALRDAARAADAPARRAALERAVALYRAPLLSGWYEDWIDPERSRLADACARALQNLTGLLWDDGERDAAIASARRAVQADPLEEESHRLLMRLLARAGRHDEARRQFAELESALQDELGRRPSPLTRELAQNLPAADAPLALRLVPGGAERTVAPEATPRPRGYLPRPLTRFFGRSVELAQLEVALAPGGDTRLVTVLGPGGTGKTRLALEAARHVEARYDGRVWFVSLAEVAAPELLPTALAAALRLEVGPDADPLALVRDTLDAGPALLILDNAEGLHDAVAELVGWLLGEAPELSCLVTSRVSLECDGQRIVPLTPLPAPTLDAAAPEALLGYPSVALFLDRAQAVRPDFQVTARNAAAIGALCRRLDGWPLALELVAAWAWSLTPAQMVERVAAPRDGRESLLATERRGIPERHRSLRTILDSAAELLSPAERAALARLSVFCGGFTADAAQAVAGDDALSALASLRRQALLTATESDDGLRFGLLELVREYADAQLSAAERLGARAAHRRYFAAVAADARGGIESAQSGPALRSLDHERENIWSALQTGIDDGDGATALAIAADAWPVWYALGRATESSALLERVLAAAPDDAAPRGEALLGLGRLLAARGLAMEAQRAFTAALETFRARGETTRLAVAAINLSLAARDTADLPSAVAALETYADAVGDDDPWAARWAQTEAATLRGASDESGRDDSIAEIFLQLGFVAGERGDLAAGRSLLEEARQAAAMADDPELEALVCGRLARLAQRQCDETGARRYRDSAQVLTRTLLHTPENRRMGEAA